MQMEMSPTRAVVPIVTASTALPIGKVLGSGFFVGDEDHLYVVTAKHVIEDNPLEEGQRYAIVFRGSRKLAVVATMSIRASPTFDVAACEMPTGSFLDEAIRLPIATSDPALNDDVLCFEYSSTRIERKPSGGKHITFEPYAHKGNIVLMYESTFPEAVPTPVMLTSFPALQGASGAPILVKTQPRRTFAAVGIMLSNFERHLMPAQVLSVESDDGIREEVRYFLPYGKALARRQLAVELRSMGVPFESAAISKTNGLESEAGEVDDEHVT